MESMANSFVEKFYQEYFENYGNNKEDLYEYVVELAYADVRRVLTGIADKQEQRDNAKSKISKELKEYLEDDSEPQNQEGFDKIHCKLCNLWIEQFNDESEKEFAMIGKAQKIVNMSFKYLYAYYHHVNSDKILEKFKYCHLILDSYTLRWLNSFQSKEKLGILNCDTKWSKIDDWSDYDALQCYARKRLKENWQFENVTLLQAEFVIWNGVMVYDIVNACRNIKKRLPDKEKLERLLQQEEMDEGRKIEEIVSFLATK